MRARNSAAAFVLSAALPFSALACAGRSDLDDSILDAGVEAGPYIDLDDAGPPKPKRSNKLDLLLVVDNSRNLEPAHELLTDTLPYLLSRLAKPVCVNGFGTVVAEPATQDEPCPIGVRDFAPVEDIHIGVISTSIGGHGADVCSEKSAAFDPTNNDRARLISRDQGGGVVPTWQDKGFLLWDPGQTAGPPGDFDVDALGSKLQTIVRGAGTKGCGFEAQLESIYRFLVDPSPYLDMVVENNAAVPKGEDDVLLQQRADFLRPDSVVAVVLLTDENDCSTREGGQYFYSNQGNGPDGKAFRMPRARSVCLSAPDDPCCVSCAQATPGGGCPPAETDPACSSPSTVEEDPINLRCFDQKRRFGIDFLYPTSRYVDAFTKPVVTNREGELVQNPLFAGGRSKELFFFEGIVGVPWQDVAHNPGSLEAGFKPASELQWSLMLPGKDGAPPADPLMIESIDPRTGTHPLTGDAVAPSSATSALANPINGHEREIAERNDLQYACIYPLRTPKDCTGITDCECDQNVATNPVCQASDGTYSNTQRFARANPATRELSVVRGLGSQGVVASICADEVNAQDKKTFGYKPAVDALLRAIRWRLAPAEKL